MNLILLEKIFASAENKQLAEQYDVLGIILSYIVDPQRETRCAGKRCFCYNGKMTRPWMHNYIKRSIGSDPRTGLKTICLEAHISIPGTPRIAKLLIAERRLSYAAETALGTLHMWEEKGEMSLGMFSSCVYFAPFTRETNNPNIYSIRQAPPSDQTIYVTNSDFNCNLGKLKRLEMDAEDLRRVSATTVARGAQEIQDLREKNRRLDECHEKTHKLLEEELRKKHGKCSIM